MAYTGRMKRNKLVPSTLKAAPRQAPVQVASVRLARVTRVRMISHIVNGEPSQAAVEEAVRLAERARSAKNASFVSQYCATT